MANDQAGWALPWKTGLPLEALRALTMQASIEAPRTEELDARLAVIPDRQRIGIEEVIHLGRSVHESDIVEFFHLVKERLAQLPHFSAEESDTYIARLWQEQSRVKVHRCRFPHLDQGMTDREEGSSDRTTDSKTEGNTVGSPRKTGQEPVRLSRAEQDILEVIRNAKRRLTTKEVLSRLRQKHGEASEGTTKQCLAGLNRLARSWEE